MKRLRPSMRENYRYILVRIIPEDVLTDGLDLYHVISDAVTALYGDADAAKIRVAVPYCDKNFFIVRCRRGTEKKVETVLATISCYKEARVAFHPVRTSGTIKTLKEKIISYRKYETCTEKKLFIKGKSLQCIIHNDSKTDVKERNDKNQTILFLTTEDIEELS